jgi:hypothetical protein
MKKKENVGEALLEDIVYEKFLKFLSISNLYIQEAQVNHQQNI